MRLTYLAPLALTACVTVENSLPSTAPPDAGSSSSSGSSSGTPADPDSSAPDAPTSQQGLFYGACLSELAAGQPSKVFNFWVETTSGDGKLTMRLQPLIMINQAPPPTVTKSGTIGAVLPSLPADIDAGGHAMLVLETITIPGAANPITGSDVVITSTLIETRFVSTKTKFCGRLGGSLVKPEAAARELKPAENVCRFVPIVDGQTTPTFTAADFAPEACPF